MRLPVGLLNRSAVVDPRKVTIHIYRTYFTCYFIHYTLIMAYAMARNTNIVCHGSTRMCSEPLLVSYQSN